MEATFISSNSFSVLGDKTEEFVENRRLKIDCGVDGTKYVKVVSSTFSSVTTVVVDESVLTSNIIGVLYGVVKPGDIGNLPDHFHTNTEGDGGYIEPPPLDFISLADTPTTYSGTLSQYAISTGSGIEFQDLPEFSTTFLDLEDTPTTYSGTEGYFAKSTGSGIELLEVNVGTSDVQTFLDLTDTPSTYSGTEGQYSVSTGSGVSFVDFNGAVIYTSPSQPTTLDGNIGDFYIDSSNEVFYEKTSDGTTTTTSQAKSVIIDIADNWGDPNNVGIRSIEFKYNGVLIPNHSPTAYATTTYTDVLYPNAWNPDKAFNTDLLKTGDNIGTTWYSATGNPSNQRLIVLLDSPIVFDEIVINNSHHSGNPDVDMGARNVKIYISTDSISDTTYGASINNSLLIFDDEISMHPQIDIIDDQSYTPTDGNYSENNGWESILHNTDSFIALTDTPTTYSGTEGYFAKSTGSGVSWSEIKNNFIDLDDTPTTYSGISNRYLRTTVSGIEAFDGLIVTSSGGYDWLIKVTDNGILYTEEL